MRRTKQAATQAGEDGSMRWKYQRISFGVWEFMVQ